MILRNEERTKFQFETLFPQAWIYWHMHRNNSTYWAKSLILVPVYTNLFIQGFQFCSVQIIVWFYSCYFILFYEMSKVIYALITGHDCSRDSVVGTATGYGLDDRGVTIRVPVGSRIFSSPNRPELLWGPPSHLSYGYWGLFLRG
jgi:hypothetical protein